MKLERLVMPAAAARRLGISRQRVHVLMKRGSLGVRQWQGRTYITADSLERYEAMPPPVHPNQKAGVRPAQPVKLPPEPHQFTLQQNGEIA